MSERLQAYFPALQTSPFHVTTPADHKYNCIAWAAGAATAWWWPVGDSPSIEWPPKAPRELTVDAFAAAFSAQGYLDITNESSEPSFEKVAILADATGTPTHAARQLPSGRWTSKLGGAEDIEHELHALEGDIYGRVVLLLKRSRP